MEGRTAAKAGQGFEFGPLDLKVSTQTTYKGGPVSPRPTLVANMAHSFYSERLQGHRLSV